MQRFADTDGSAVYLKAIIFLLAANIVAGIVAASVKEASGYDLLADSMFNYAVMTVFQALNGATVYYHIFKSRRRPGIFFSRVRPETPFIGIAAALLCLFGFYGTAFAFQRLLDVTGYVGQTGISLDSAGDIVFGVLVTVVFAPLCEELVYRGALLSGLRRRFSAPAAVLLSGLAFSFMHMSLQQTVYQFFLGCSCAALALSARSVWPAVAAHAASNLTAVVMDVTPLGGAFEEFVGDLCAGAATLFTILSAAAAAAAITGLTVVLKKRALPAERCEPQEEKEGALGKHTAVILYLFALGITLAMWTATLVQGYNG